MSLSSVESARMAYLTDRVAFSAEPLGTASEFGADTQRHIAEGHPTGKQRREKFNKAVSGLFRRVFGKAR